MTTEQIEKEVLNLPVDERARLAELLLSSLDKSPDSNEVEEIEAAWLVEADRRLQEILEGKTTTIPAEEVMRKLRSRHKG